MKSCLIAIVYAAIGIAGLYYWELIRAWGAFSFGLYQPFMGSEGYAFLSGLFGIALFISWLVALKILRPRAAGRAVLQLVIAFMVWFPLSFVAMIPFGKVELFLAAGVLTAGLPPVVYAVVARRAEPDARANAGERPSCG